ncbi:transporter, nitrate/nitrite porter (NNP) family protein, putative [Acaryochloris marina MBIC11017]|uniref:Transporter, nitrate/nitrite porter (NNP) family protein, putative n=1 Tax=Acaryochloris marina (strain MBIC 11017) TaxID=329726 RepID=B0C7N9_ACAM1|nr:transporter, nitrate/nitrite porter (NNP) family protein, putative [Acaryochloris marina MBIC11017]
MNQRFQSQPYKSLCLATIAFAISFASWGVIAGVAPLLKQELGLSATQVSLMVAIPVLLAALGRIPLGILTNRFGGRLVFSLLLILGIIPPVALALNHSYLSLLF